MSMTAEDRTPVLVGAGQFVQRDVDPREAKHPLAMMEEASRLAAQDAGTGDRLWRHIDCVAVVNILSWHSPNPPRLLAEALGAAPCAELYTTVGGNTPQSLVNELAARISRGAIGATLIAGAEAIHTLRRARRNSVALQWPTGGSGEPELFGDQRPGSNEHEHEHGLRLPITVYPLFENAIRAHRRWSISEHRQRLALLCSRLSEVAARNPYAWFPTRRSPEEISTPGPGNRMIAFPYLKLMNPIMDVDQSAALIMMSVARARQLGVPRDRWVYLWGGAEAHDHWFVSERVNYHSSPAIRAAGEAALQAAGLTIDQIDLFDLYSCFPCAVQIGAAMLGIPDEDSRPLTVTGGLPYAGGPGSNYVTHSIATMMAELRRRSESKGLVTGLGWYLTKHAVGIYSSEPPPSPWTPERTVNPQAQARVEAESHPALVTNAQGRAVIETYTVVHDRDGAPVQGIIVGRLTDGRRFLANTPAERRVLKELMEREAIGRSGTVRADGPIHRFTPD